MVGIKLLDIFDLNLSRPADRDHIVHAYVTTPTDTCLYQMLVDSKDTLIMTFKMPVQQWYKYSGL